MVKLLQEDYDDLIATKEAYGILLNVIAEKGLIPEFQERLNEMKIDLQLEREG